MASNGSNLVSKGLFWLLLAGQCSLVWLYPYFPSQDGPAHLHNASVMAHYNATPIYQQYYELREIQPAGNLSAQLLLSGLVKWMPPLLAEKLLITLYLVGFFLAFRYLLGAVSRNGDWFAPLAGILAPNAFLYLGFWNFCLSMPLAFLLMGWAVRKQGQWRPTEAALLVAGGLGLYATHSVSWIMTLMVMGLLGLERLARQWSEGQSWKHLIPALCLAPPAGLMLAFVSAQQDPRCGFPVSLRERIWGLYTFNSLKHLVENSWGLYLKVVLVLVVAVAGGAAWQAVRKRKSQSNMFAVAAVLAVAMVLTLPDCLGSGSYIHGRVALYGLILVAVWASAQSESWSMTGLMATALSAGGIALLGLGLTIPTIREWNARLDAVVQVAREIPENSAVLMLYLSPPVRWVSPYLHSTHQAAGRRIIDLRNYEASTNHFLTRFRAERSPFPRLGTIETLAGQNIRFDVDSYERETRGRVDYLLFLREGPAPLETTVNGQYGTQLQGFELVRQVNEGPAQMLLYRKRSGHSGQ